MMMKNLLDINRFPFVIGLCLCLLGCEKTDDTTPSEGNEGRPRIVMELPSNDEEIDWEDVTLVKNEEFKSGSILGEEWSFEPNSANPDVADELQVYQNANVEVSNGTLKIYARKTGTGQNKGDYTSARISGNSAYQYGRIEVGARLPRDEKNGLWGKIGFLGDNELEVGWPECGEFNIMEYVSHNPNEVYITVHSNQNNASEGTLISATGSLETAEEEFHAYGILWTDKYIKFYIDDVDNILYTLNRPAVATPDNWPFDQPFYMIVHLVVGGKYGGQHGVDDSIFPALMELSYLKVYHLN